MSKLLVNLNLLVINVKKDSKLINIIPFKLKYLVKKYFNNLVFISQSKLYMHCLVVNSGSWKYKFIKNGEDSNIKVKIKTK